jgi:ABC-2 type transport system permease protein
MNGFRFWTKITIQTLGKLCRQRMLLAGIVLLCLFLPLCLAPVAETALSQGVSFSGITLAIVGPEGSSVPAEAEKLLSNMRDVSQYCQVRAMTMDEALENLEQEQVTAIMVLPEGFVSGVMYGTNPDLELIVPDDRPFEALLTLWVGQSASDMLSAIQSGIYAVIDQYHLSPAPELTQDEVIAQINVRYINWTLNRQGMFRTSSVSATELLPVGLHYGLSLLGYLMLALVPFFTPVFSGKWISSQKRFRCAKRGWLGFYLCGVGACFAVMFVLFTAAQLLMVKGDLVMTLYAAMAGSLFCAGYTAVCCLITGNTRNCGVLTFPAALVFLFLSGGILPPVLMPPMLQRFMDLSPITWLRNTMAVPGGELYPDQSMAGTLLIWSVILLVIGSLLYRRRSLTGKEDAV